MAYLSGTASDYRDLLRQVRTFVTTIMTPIGERWTEQRWVETATTQEWLIRGPGLAGTDQIFGGIYSSQDTGFPYYRWEIMGHTGFVTGNDFVNQPGRIPAGQVYPTLALSNAPMAFWLIASGRRIVLIVKVGTIYQAMYLGFILPYATPGQYPYPLFVGGSQANGRNSQPSQTGYAHRHFVSPAIGNISSFDSTARLRVIDGRWATFANYSSSDTFATTLSYGTIFPGNWAKLGSLRESVVGNIYTLTPFVLMESISGTNNIFGELDGCFHVSGFNNAAENIIQVGGQDYLVIQNVYRTTVIDYWAMRLT